MPYGITSRIFASDIRCLKDKHFEFHQQKHARHDGTAYMALVDKWAMSLMSPCDMILINKPILALSAGDDAHLGKAAPEMSTRL